MAYIVYETTPTRALRVKWAMAELGLDYESRDGVAAMQSGELAQHHPLNRLPVLIDDGRTLFESAAICTWLADSHADQGLIPPVGSWERAQHDQWVSFVLTEVEAYLWHTFRHTNRLPEEDRVEAVVPQNTAHAAAGLKVLDDHLADQAYLLGDSFQITDIIAGFTVNWGFRMGAGDGLANLAAYRERLMAREHCPLPA